MSLHVCIYCIFEPCIHRARHVYHLLIAVPYNDDLVTWSLLSLLELIFKFLFYFIWLFFLYQISPSMILLYIYNVFHPHARHTPGILTPLCMGFSRGIGIRCLVLWRCNITVRLWSISRIPNHFLSPAAGVLYIASLYEAWGGNEYFSNRVCRRH